MTQLAEIPNDIDFADLEPLICDAENIFDVLHAIIIELFVCKAEKGAYILDEAVGLRMFFLADLAADFIRHAREGYYTAIRNTSAAKRATATPSPSRIIALFAEWDRLRDASNSPEIEGDDLAVSDACDRANAVMRVILDEPARDLRDFAAKLMATMHYGDYGLGNGKYDYKIVQEAAAILGVTAKLNPRWTEDAQ